MDGGAWWAAVHGVAKSQTRLNDLISLSFRLRTNFFSPPLLSFPELLHLRWHYFASEVLSSSRETEISCENILRTSWDFLWEHFFGRNDAKAETPVLWPPHAKSWLIGKDPDAGKDWGQEEKGLEDEMAGWHPWLDGRESQLNSGSWWWTGRPGVLQFMGLQRVGLDWVIWSDLIWWNLKPKFIKQSRMVVVRNWKGERNRDMLVKMYKLPEDK